MALSGAERQRRYMARLKAGSVTDDAASQSSKAVTDEFVRLKAFANHLERENAALKAVTDESVFAKLRAENAALKEKLTDAARLQAENKALKEKLAATERRADQLSRSTPRGATMTASQLNKILRCVHPDTVARFKDDKLTKQLTEASQLINGLRSDMGSE